MNITPVGYKQNTQPTFKGYVSKDVLNIINTSAKNVIKREIKTANKENRIADVSLIENVKLLADLVTTRLTTFMKELHKDTYLTLDDYSRNFVLKNPKLGSKPHEVVSSAVFSPSDKLDGRHYNPLDIHKLSRHTLTKIDSYTKKLMHKTNYKQIDREMFEKYISELKSSPLNFIKPLFKRRLKKADKLAPEFGHLGGLEKLLYQEKQKTDLNKANIKKANKEIADKYLK